MSAFRFIAAEKASHPISVMCRMLEVSTSGFHAWLRRPPSDLATLGRVAAGADP